MPGEYQPEDYIETFSGRRFEFISPKLKDIDIVDIAHALSNACRYNGHCIKFYSVAEHSMLLAAKYHIEYPDDPAGALAFLLHDAAEAYLCDIPRPIKYTLDDYRALEMGLDMAVRDRFDLRFPKHASIKDWDSRIIVDERAQNMNKSGNVWGVDHLEPLNVKLHYFTPPVAEEKFLLWYKALTI